MKYAIAYALGALTGILYNLQIIRGDLSFLRAQCASNELLGESASPAIRGSEVNAAIGAAPEIIAEPYYFPEALSISDLGLTAAGGPNVGDQRQGE